jgi:purine-nucleoside phosphorylase
MTTPHNRAVAGDIAEKILLPGDPLRAKYLAENFLENPVLFNDVRNMFGYTGTYKGEPVSVMGTGMGIPSIAIYSYELIHHYGVKKLIRIGTCGAYHEYLELGDLIFAIGASTDSDYAAHFKLPGTYSAVASWPLLKRAAVVAEEKKVPVHVGNILTSDIFYDAFDPDSWKQWAKMGILCVDMETYALYCNAAAAGVEALTMLSVSDNARTGKKMSSLERQEGLRQMMEIALEI